jgi:hypothetical protein
MKEIGNEMLLYLAIFFGVVSVIILHVKAFKLYLIENPGKVILEGYLTGIIGIYLAKSFLPIFGKQNKTVKEYKRLNILTYLFYIFLGLFFLMVLLA